MDSAIWGDERLCVGVLVYLDNEATKRMNRVHTGGVAWTDTHPITMAALDMPSGPYRLEVENT